MPTTSRPRRPTENRLLSALPSETYQRLLPDLTTTCLNKGKVLYEAGDHVRACYFPVGGMISLLSTTEDGETIEVSMVGDEGMVGVPAILGVNITPYEIMVQIETDALMVKADVLRREFTRGGRLHDLLLRYTHALLCQISQSAVCNRFHTIDQRLCRWLLISRDRVHADTFPLTQEFISHMLGVPRTSVTMTAGELQRAGLILYTRGRITILDGNGLEAAACECYRVVKNETDNFFAA